MTMGLRFQKGVCNVPVLSFCWWSEKVVSAQEKLGNVIRFFPWFVTTIGKTRGAEWEKWMRFGVQLPRIVDGALGCGLKL